VPASVNQACRLAHRAATYVTRALIPQNGTYVTLYAGIDVAPRRWAAGGAAYGLLGRPNPAGTNTSRSTQTNWRWTTPIFENSCGSWPIEIKAGTFRTADLHGLLEFPKRHPNYRPLLICDLAGLSIAERAGVEAVAWRNFLIHGFAGRDRSDPSRRVVDASCCRQLQGVARLPWFVGQLRRATYESQRFHPFHKLASPSE
jgi:hypothetical protein